MRQGSIAFDLVELPDGVLVRCEGTLNDATSVRLLQAIGRLLAIPVPYLCLDLRDLDSADETLVYVLEASSAVAAIEGVRLEMIPGPAVLAVIQPPATGAE